MLSRRIFFFFSRLLIVFLAEQLAGILVTRPCSFTIDGNVLLLLYKLIKPNQIRLPFY